jgi:hypothetical protein
MTILSTVRTQNVRARFLIAAALFALAIILLAFGTPNARALSTDGAAAAPAAAPAAGADVPMNATSIAPWREPIVPADKQITVHVRNGIFTYDGLTAKVRLNYDVKAANYMYFYIPGLGTAIVSRVQIPGAIKVKNAVHGEMLAFMVGGHIFELANQGGSLDEHAGTFYVVLDTAANNLDHDAMVGYGNTLRAPYQWPLSGSSPKDNDAHFVPPPPMPVVLLPKTVAITKTPQKPATEVSAVTGNH